MLTEIQQALAELADPQVALASQRFFKTGAGQYGEGDHFRGIRVPVLRQLARKYQGISLAETEQLLHSSFHEDRLLALLLLVRLYASGDDDDEARATIYRLYLANSAFINNWDLVDSSAEHIVGAFLRDKDRQPLHDLALSRDLWERRIAILATFHFIKRGEFTPTLDIARLLLSDEEDLIHKAVGWMLREVGKRDQATEEAFLKEHYRQMPRVMLRYAIEKFPEEKRQSYLKGQA